MGHFQEGRVCAPPSFSRRGQPHPTGADGLRPLARSPLAAMHTCAPTVAAPGNHAPRLAAFPLAQRPVHRCPSMADQPADLECPAPATGYRQGGADGMALAVVREAPASPWELPGRIPIAPRALHEIGRAGGRPVPRRETPNAKMATRT